jgi:uncharacterized protein YjiS (DUF1127 family)
MAALSGWLFVPRRHRGAWPVRALDAVLAWQERARQRRRLAALDERMLRDIGLGAAEVRAEWEKPFWRP